MILKRNFNPIKVLAYVWAELLVTFVLASLVFVGYEIYQFKQIAIPFAPLGVLGSAIAFFLGFRNSASFARWSQASNFWVQIQNQSRIFARLIITFVNSHAHTPAYKKEIADNFVKSMIYRQLAFVNTLRLTLREQNNFEEMKSFLSKEDFDLLQTKSNKPSYLLKMQGTEIYKAMANGTLQGFDSFQLEGCLLQLSTQLANCYEGIKTTPMPRQYDYFTRLFVRIFIYIFPFAMIETFAKGNITLLLIPFSLLISFVFVITEKIGTVNEDPFENRIQDVPMTAICTAIERDLKELLDETNIPAKKEVVDGYLF
jgi:putative membrane protein